VLRNTAGITFLAAEGGEEDIRLRGFSLARHGRHLHGRHARPGLL
jgi:catecholate siderophore receptor